MNPIFKFDVEVTADVVDGNGHVNNVVYIQWMQEAAIRHAQTSGCTQASLAAGATWVARTHQIEYFSPAFAGDTITVLTWFPTSARCVRYANISSSGLLTKPFWREQKPIGCWLTPKPVGPGQFLTTSKKHCPLSGQKWNRGIANTAGQATMLLQFRFRVVARPWIAAHAAIAIHVDIGAQGS